MQINDCSIRVSRSYAQCSESKAKTTFNLPYAYFVLCVYPEKYMPLRVQSPGYPDLHALVRAGYVTRFKLTF